MSAEAKKRNGLWCSRGLALCVLLAAAALLLLLEHRAHLLESLLVMLLSYIGVQFLNGGHSAHRNEPRSSRGERAE